MYVVEIRQSDNSRLLATACETLVFGTGHGKMERLSKWSYTKEVVMCNRKRKVSTLEHLLENAHASL